MKKRKRGKKKKKKKKEKGNDKRGISDKHNPTFTQNQGIYEYIWIYTVDYFNQERNTDIFLPGGLGAVLALRASHDVNRPVTRRVGREAAVLAASIASAALPASSTAAMPASSSASSLAA